MRQRPTTSQLAVIDHESRAAHETMWADHRVGSARKDHHESCDCLETDAQQFSRMAARRDSHVVLHQGVEFYHECDGLVTARGKTV